VSASAADRPTGRPSTAFLGVDAGGSHTEVALAVPDGTILARGRGPGAAARPGQ
jgi:N-acetylglucosamine kinase-like BadF-type ATPase